MLKKFFDTTAVDAFAAWVVDELKRLRPPGSLESESKAAVKQRNRFDAGLLSKIESTAIGSHLNFYQKAILGSRLEERLEAAGLLARVRAGAVALRSSGWWRCRPRSRS